MWVKVARSGATRTKIRLDFKNRQAFLTPIVFGFSLGAPFGSIATKSFSINQLWDNYSLSIKTESEIIVKMNAHFAGLPHSSPLAGAQRNSQTREHVRPWDSERNNSEVGFWGGV